MTREPLSDTEIERLDYVHNAVHQLLCDLAGVEVPWDISVIGDISDIAEECIAEAEAEAKALDKEKLEAMRISINSLPGLDMATDEGKHIADGLGEKLNEVMDWLANEIETL